MALPYTRQGSFIRGGGIISALIKQTKQLNLKPVKKINFSFDPFREDSIIVRRALNFFYQERVRDTNPKCVLKTSVLSNRTEPLIEVNLVDGKTILFKAENLQTLEILQKYNELVSSKVQAEEKATQGKKPKLTKSQRRR